MLPLFGADNARAGLHELGVDLAVRYDDYSDLEEGSTTNPKYGINWAPIDALKFRGTYGESFRAPTFAQIYGNSSALFVQNYSDPTQGRRHHAGHDAVGRQSRARARNRDALIRSASTMQPSPIPAFNLTYFHIDYEKQITSYLSDLTILNREEPVRRHGHHRPQSRSGLHRRIWWRPSRSAACCRIPSRSMSMAAPTTSARRSPRASTSRRRYDLEPAAAGKFGFGLDAPHTSTPVRGGDHAGCRPHRSAQHHLQPAAIQGARRCDLEPGGIPGRVVRQSSGCV